MTPRTKGYIYAVAQFSLGGIIIILSFIEHYNIVRIQIPVINIISIVLLVICAVVMLLAFFNFGQYITPNPVPRDTAVLRTTGIYSLIRHPMYSGALFGLVGFPLYYTAYYTLLLDILMVLFFMNKIKFEEKHLLSKYPEYTEYQTKTKKLIPFIY